MSVALDSVYNDFSKAIEQTRQHLLMVDSAVLAASAIKRDVLVVTRASSYVWVAAALEVFVNDTLTVLLGEIESQQVPCRDLSYGLFSMLSSPALDSLRDLSGLKAWKRRAEVMSLFSTAVPANFGSRAVPLDGRTIRRDHFETIWEVFGLPGTPLPGHSHRFALEDLAGTRNRLAHGEVDPVLVGRSKTTSDMINILNRVDEVGYHLWAAASGYLSSKSFLR